MMKDNYYFNIVSPLIEQISKQMFKKQFEYAKQISSMRESMIGQITNLNGED